MDGLDPSSQNYAAQLMKSPAATLAASIPMKMAEAQDAKKDATESNEAFKKSYTDLVESQKERKIGVDEAAKAYPGGVTPLKLPEAPKQEIRNPLEAFGSSAGLMAILAGAIGRRSITHVLQAATGAMNGMKQGDYDQFKANYDNWKEQTEVMKENHKSERESYLDVLNSKDKDVSEKLAMWTALGHAYQNANVIEMAREGNVEGIAKSLHDWKQAEERNNIAYQDMKLKAKTFEDQHAEAMRKQEDAAEKEGALKELQAARASGDPDKIKQAQQNFIDVEAKTNPSIMSAEIRTNASNTRARSPDAMIMQQFIDDYKSSHNDAMPSAPEMQQFRQENAGRMAAAKTYAPGGKVGEVINKFNVAVGHTEALKDYALALDSGDVQTINAAKNKLMTEFGDPDPDTFTDAASWVSDELTGAILGGPGGVTDRQKAADAFKAASSTQTKMAIIDERLRLMTGQLEGRKFQYEKATGLKNFDDHFLMPETKQALAKYRHGEEKPIIQIENDDEWNALAPGTDYIGPDGSKRTKK